MTELQKLIERLGEALKPFAAIADEYDAEGLNEARPHWIKTDRQKADLDIELYAGRSGKTLITLRHVMQARLALTGKPFSILELAPEVAQAKEVYNALYIGGRTWEELRPVDQEEYIKKVAALKKGSAVTCPAR